VRRHLVINRYERTLINDRVRRESGHSEMMVQRLRAETESSRSAQKSSFAVSCAADRARSATILSAAVAFTATRKESHHDPLADLNSCDAVSKSRHGASRFVSEEHRYGTRPVAVHD
jgi:hypothetical protein